MIMYSDVLNYTGSERTVNYRTDVSKTEQMKNNTKIQGE